jgi:hypothetical protein
MTFEDAAQGLLNGDFSRLDPLFVSPPGEKSRIVAWFDDGAFDHDADALLEAFTCACFNGRNQVVDHLLAANIDPDRGNRTGMTAFHWAANRGQVETVRRLIAAKASLEALNRFGGSVLGCAVWSAIHEPRDGQLAVIELLLEAGARVAAAGYPTGDARIDALLLRHGAKP